MEAQLRKIGKGVQDLSELHMGYATSNTSGNTIEGNNRAPSAGGNRNGAANYLMRGTNLSGVVDEASAPYIPTSIGKRDLDISRSKEKVWQAQNIVFLTGNRDENASDAIKQAVMTYGAVGVSIYTNQTTATNGSSRERA